jgi:hypothetical protein
MITPDFAAYAVRVDVHFAQQVPPAEVRSKVEKLMMDIARACMAEGAALIGHIKCVVETPGQGFLATSVTDVGTGAVSRGQLEEGIKDMDVVINVLLYGLTRAKVQRLVDPLARYELSFPRAEVELEDLEKEHAHDHEHHDHEHGHEHAHDHEHERGPERR